jgi:hypothetical protein
VACFRCCSVVTAVPVAAAAPVRERGTVFSLSDSLSLSLSPPEEDLTPAAAAAAVPVAAVPVAAVPVAAVPVAVAVTPEVVGGGEGVVCGLIVVTGGEYLELETEADAKGEIRPER